MTFEISLAAAMLTLAALAVIHDFATRERSDALWLLGTGIGFGYIFPLADINLFGQYTFHGEITVLNIPPHLGLAWFGLYSMSLGLAEFVLGKQAGRVRLALLAGTIFGLLEIQWDPTLLHLGVMELFLPSFATYPLGFNPGVPMCHVFFGFAYAYAFLVFRGSRLRPVAFLLALGTLVLWPLGLMAVTPFAEPIYAYFAERLGHGALVAMDLVHFSTTFAGTGLCVALWLRFLGRRLGSRAEGAGGEGT